MYSQRVRDRLDGAGVRTGNRAAIDVEGSTFTGRIMPRSDDAGEGSDVLVLKLDNGYNLGISIDRINEISAVETETGSGATGQPDIPAADPDKPTITILHTGGTIASRVSYEAGGVKPAFEPEDLLSMYPELFDRVNVESHVVAQMLSEDMEPAHWQQIAEGVAEHRDADGIIIGHGTDTMQYTAAALSFMLENIDVPVVLVGAQRSSDRPSSDAAMNLLSAAAFIEEGIPGVYVCMHAESADDTAAIHRGTRVRKMHTSRRDAFQSIDTVPVAEVSYPDGTVSWNETVTPPSGEFRLRTDMNTNVGLLKTYPGMDPALLDAYTSFDGIIIEGTGLGHMPVNAFDEHTQHHEDILANVRELAADSVVAMASQCIAGRVNMNVYDAGVKIQDAGVVSADSMTPETAYVKLMWALGQTDTKQAAETLFQENIAGEHVAREEYDAY